jgi:hypothetical protein
LTWLRRMLKGILAGQTEPAPLPSRQRPTPIGGWRPTPAYGPHGFIAVHGESFHQEALRDLIAQRRGRRHPVFTARLLAEPTNPVDPHAVAVLIDPVGIVGHLPKDTARRYCQLVAAHANGITCPAQLVGGTKAKPTIGVVLDFIAVDKLKTGRT